MRMRKSVWQTGRGPLYTQRRASPRTWRRNDEAPLS